VTRRSGAQRDEHHRLGLAGLGGRAAWSSVVEILQLASSVLVFVVLAGLMTTAEYGRMGAVLSVVAPAVGLSNVGSHVLLIKRIAQGADVQRTFKQAISVGVGGPAVGSVVAIALQPVLLPTVEFWVVALIIVGQLNFYWATELTIFLGTALRRLREAAEIRIIATVFRFGSLFYFALFTRQRLVDWAVVSFVAFGISCLLAFVHVWRRFGVTPSLRHGSRADLAEGFPFSITSVPETLVDVSDRVLLERYGHSVDAGIYSLGGRIVQFGYLPLRILLRATDADLFEAGKQGVSGALRVSRRLLGPGLAIGFGASIALWVGAPLVPLLVGDKYDEAVSTIRLLSVLPLIRALQYIVGNCLSASGHQVWRLGATIAAAVLNLGLNLVLLVNGTWRTAVYTTFATELFLTLALMAVLAQRARRDEPGLPDGDHPSDASPPGETSAALDPIGSDGR
jgi:O-antigen/teichoic acid export membrane protein